MALLQAQKQTQEAFMRYTACLDAERQAQQHVDEISKCAQPSILIIDSSTHTLLQCLQLCPDRLEVVKGLSFLIFDRSR
jgi:hypothetical protein